MKPTARTTGTAPTSLLLPTNESTTHSTRRHEVATERISQTASPRDRAVDERSSGFFVTAAINYRTRSRPGQLTVLRHFKGNWLAKELQRPTASVAAFVHGIDPRHMELVFITSKRT